MEHLSSQQKTITMLAIISTTIFVGLNTTIINTALPRIVADIGGMEYFSWIFTTFMLTSSITTILVGKLSDIYGRKIFILSGLVFFITGALLAGFSANIFQMIICRGIQGVGGGMLVSTSFAAVGDLFSPRERARWQGLMGAAYGVASVLGPAIGGYIVDNADWHWIFWVFIPLGIFAFLLILKLFPAKASNERVEIDYLGSIFITIFMVSLLLSFTWAGSKYPWRSWEVFGLLSSSIVAISVFFMVEKKVTNPVIPLNLFKNKIFLISNLISFFMGIGMFSIIMFMPFFVQGVLGATATKSGYIVIPLTLVMMIVSPITGQVVSRTGKYKKLGLVGLAIMAFGIFLTSLMNSNSSLITGAINMSIVGIGLGICFPIFNLTTQNAVEHKFLGVATATTQMFRHFGGTIGVTLLSLVMNFRFADRFEAAFNQSGTLITVQNDPEASVISALIQNPQELMNTEKLAQMEAMLPLHLKTAFVETIELLRATFEYSLTGVFLVAALIVLAALIIGFFLEEIPLRTSND
ncbi:MAG: MFS transporter [Clostridia bacterium]|jgi:EmrB/QacA subfamily drug resistance transporter|nr:MFS transporter [Clostridia bacterium]